MNKIKEWINRYKYAELASIFGFGTACVLVKYFNINAVVSSVLITYIEFVFYYLTMILVQQKSTSNSTSVFETIFHLLKEFGVAEIVDLLFSRSFFLFICPIIFNNFSVGIIVGKICADIVFYILTIFFYEKMKRNYI